MPQCTAAADVGALFKVGSVASCAGYIHVLRSGRIEWCKQPGLGRKTAG